MKEQSFADNYEEMAVDELEFALEDLNNAIVIEKHKLQHTCSPRRIEKHWNNIWELEAEADYVRKRIKELVCE